MNARAELARPLRIQPRRCSAVALFAALLVTSGCGDPTAAPVVDFALSRAGLELGDGSSIDFGTIAIDSTALPAPVELTLTNRSPDPWFLADGLPVQLENDSSLAFRLVLPRVSEIAPRTSVTLTVLFAPRRAGQWEADLVLAPDSRRAEPLTVRLVATASEPSVAPITAARLIDANGQPLSLMDFGNVEAGSPTTLSFGLENTGNVAIDPNTFSWSMTPDATPFTVTPPTGSIEPGTSGSGTVSVTIDTCGEAMAELEVIAADGSTPVGTVELKVASVPTRSTLPTFMPTSLSDAVVHAIAVAGPEDGGLRVVLGKSDAESFRGVVRVVDFDGCTSGNPTTLYDIGATNLWGHRVALTDAGDMALVTWSDRAEARLFRLDPANFADSTSVRLGTFISGGGHGQAAGLSGDGGVAVIGQRFADSGFNAHGGLWLYERIGATWQDMPETRFRLVPLEPPRVDALGTSTAVSANGDVIIGGAQYLSSISVPGVYEAALLVWAASVDPSSGRTWGRIVPQQDSDRRAETQLLRSEVTPVDEVIQVAMSRDGSVLGLAFKSDFQQLEVHIFELNGEGVWGLQGNPTTRRVANHVATIETFDDWGFAMSPDGRRIIVSDSAGIVALRRSADAWGAGSVLDGSWDQALYGPIAFTPDGNAIVGVDDQGALHLLRVDAPW
jgi:hypothetical protein